MGLIFHVLLVAIVLITKNVSLWQKALWAGGYLIFVPCWWLVSLQLDKLMSAYVDVYTTFNPFWLWLLAPIGVAFGARTLLTRKRKEIHS